MENIVTSRGSRFFSFMINLIFKPEITSFSAVSTVCLFIEARKDMKKRTSSKRSPFLLARFYYAETTFSGKPANK